MKEAYIVSSVRTPGCRRGKGALAQTRPEELLVQALNGVVERAGVEKEAIEDVMTGCAFPEAEQAAEEIMALPIYPELTDEMKDYVAESCQAFLNE